mmetsp:Transcript_2786/g.6813  ORF Transcript_2786/g.6813 Transcript_2786/m.6813 type:complete len:82 (-) Transcript_2786:169-414(-)
MAAPSCFCALSLGVTSAGRGLLRTRFEIGGKAGSLGAARAGRGLTPCALVGVYGLNFFFKMVEWYAEAGSTGLCMLRLCQC